MLIRLFEQATTGCASILVNKSGIRIWGFLFLTYYAKPP